MPALPNRYLKTAPETPARGLVWYQARAPARGERERDKKMENEKSLCEICLDTRANCICLDCDCYAWARSLHENPETLTDALLALDGVSAVSYEYPGFWAITTARGAYDLGDAGGPIGWNDDNGENGETTATTPAEIARDFGAWLAGVN